MNKEALTKAWKKEFLRIFSSSQEAEATPSQSVLTAESEISAKDPKQIAPLFETIAEGYDRANNILSLKMHHRWNQEVAKQVTAGRPHRILLDLCAGTGEIALHSLKESSEWAKMYLLDLSSKMLTLARKKIETAFPEFKNVEYLKANAEEIPLRAHCVDTVTTAYGIRNVLHPERCMEEVWRVLVPGGRWVMLELTRPTNFLMKAGHQFYLKTIIPILVKLYGLDPSSYHYLTDSVQKFLSPEELASHLKRLGFQLVTRRSFFGGIATLIVVDKPLRS